MKWETEQDVRKSLPAHGGPRKPLRWLPREVPGLLHSTKGETVAARAPSEHTSRGETIKRFSVTLWLPSLLWKALCELHFLNVTPLTLEQAELSFSTIMEHFPFWDLSIHSHSPCSLYANSFMDYQPPRDDLVQLSNLRRSQSQRRYKALIRSSRYALHTWDEKLRYWMLALHIPLCDSNLSLF